MDAQVFEGDIPIEVRDRLLDSSVVAVDTETNGLEWARDRLGLCQMYSETVGPVLLRRVQDTPTNAAEVLGDSSIRKVFHFASFDLKFLRSQWGIAIRNVTCTKAAAKILAPNDPPASHTLAALLFQNLGIKVDKQGARTSNWFQAELSQRQIRYAVLDVQHLPRLIAILEDRLRQCGKADLFEAVCHYLPVAAELEVQGVPNPLVY